MRVALLILFITCNIVFVISCYWEAPGFEKEILVEGHTVSQHGVMHQAGLEHPFSGAEACADCHGIDLRGDTYVLNFGEPDQKNIYAPSCYQCHGEEWD